MSIFVIIGEGHSHVLNFARGMRQRTAVLCLKRLELYRPRKNHRQMNFSFCEMTTSAIYTEKKSLIFVDCWCSSVYKQKCVKDSLGDMRNLQLNYVIFPNRTPPQ